MFGSSTPLKSVIGRFDTWPRYNNSTNNHPHPSSSSSFIHPFDSSYFTPNFTQTPPTSASTTETFRDNINESYHTPPIGISSLPPSTNFTLSPSLTASPNDKEDYLFPQTPSSKSFPPSLIRNLSLSSYFTPSSNPLPSMPYPTTPSPVPFGVNAAVLMPSLKIHSSSNDVSCNNISSSQTDVFTIPNPPTHKLRQALRTTSAPNGALPSLPTPPTSANSTAWTGRRTNMTSSTTPAESNERGSHRSSTINHPNYIVNPIGPSSLLSTSAPTSTAFAAPPPPPPPPPAALSDDGSNYDNNEIGNSVPIGSQDSRVLISQGSLNNNNNNRHSFPESNAGSTNFSTSLPSFPTIIATHNNSSYAAPPPPPPALSSSHNTTSYSDDLSNSTSTSYVSHVNSLGQAYSPWPIHSEIPQLHQQHIPRSTGFYAAPPPPPPSAQIGFGYHPYFMPMASHGGKMDEPILQPGELPAPRPAISYAALIGEALLLAAPPHQLYVSEISDSIKRRYPYYRQNPSKVYNGVRHQTSMCKAFVKLPRPFGDQSGGARKWAIRAGCETWFHSGGYHPPPNASPTLSASTSMKRSSTGPAGGNAGHIGKAKATARAKQLAIGTSSPPTKKGNGNNIEVNHEPYSPSSGQGGPSVGPAFDGSTTTTSRSSISSNWLTQSSSSSSNNTPLSTSLPAPGPSFAYPLQTHHHNSQWNAPIQTGTSHPLTHGFLQQGGYHYVPIQPHQHQSMHHPHPYSSAGQPVYVPIYQPNAPAPAPGPIQHQQHHHQNSQSHNMEQHHQQSPDHHYMPGPLSSQPLSHGSPINGGGWRYSNARDNENEEEIRSPDSLSSHHSPSHASPISL